MRYFSIATLVMASIVAAFCLRYAPEASNLHFEFKSVPVAASTRDEYFLGAPFVVDAFSGTSLENGRLVHILPTDGEYTGNEALALLQNGQAQLALKNTSIKIGKSGSEPIARKGKASTPFKSVLLSSLTNMNFSELLIHDSEIEVSLPGGFTEYLSESRLTLRRRHKSSISISGTALWRGQKIKLNLQTGALQKTQSRMPIEFSMEGPNISARFTGVYIKQGNKYVLEGSFSIDIGNTRTIAQSFDLIWPSLATTKAFALSGSVKWSPTSIAFDKAVVQLDENEAIGVLTLKTNSERPLLSGTLAFDKLNLTPPATLDAGPLSLKDRLWSIAAGLWSRPMITILDADLRLSAKQVLIGPTVLDKVAATISLKNNKVSARLASLRYKDGSGAGQLTIDFDERAPHTTIRGKIDNVSLGDISHALVGKRIIDGTADITADIETSGTLLHTAIESATGQIQIAQNKAGMLNLDLTALTTDIATGPADRSTPSTTREKIFTEVLTKVSNGTTPTNELFAVIRIENGMAECKRCQIKFGSHVAKANGYLNVLSQTVAMQLLLHEQAVAPNKSTQAKATATAPNIVTGNLISIRGALLHPALQIFKVHGTPETLETFRFKIKQTNTSSTQSP